LYGLSWLVPSPKTGFTGSKMVAAVTANAGRLVYSESHSWFDIRS